MKNKMQDFFDRLTPVLDKVGNNKYLQAVMSAMMGTLGLIILGSFSVLGSVYAGRAHLTQLATLLGNVSTVTISCLALFIVFLVARALVPFFIKGDDGVAAGIIALVNFFILTPLGSIKNGKSLTAALPTTWLSAQGVFSALIIGLLSARAYVYIKQHGWTIKMPAGVPPMVTNAFANLIPTIVLGLVAMLISFLFMLTSWGSFHQMIYSIIQVPLRGIGGSIWAMIVVSLIMQILWFFGIHGTNVVFPLVTPIWLAMDMENLAAIKAGHAAPNIIGLAFFNVVTWGGLALGLVLLMLIAKSKRYRELGRLAIVPALFGITEPVIFGTPLVLNFELAIPFITNNTIALIIAYVATNIGLVGRFSGAQTIFGLPLGFHATVGGHVSIIILQLVIQLILSPLLWYPWFKHADNKALAEEQAAAK
ncbi:PTS sugar transporter subunit IIC [Schleiferilactobacillus harbinensis]|jgi:PTS system cellobiose-specific IIC component|uniref:PTS sugar transporter subunit IIC n=1 Tax=Schleiferilactobacillus harbinensis TaxID=304207 RepID=UPI001239E132|nr:PTS transporter subunit EIIC [Schleiferilactobacillus harbinensis]MCI1688660.1 PTS transporter subunit EIIC [Schleiferilactobacillus harbinensis]MCI1782965.1 PTS transporter subunit EIIC [Schleiferilactobacillus harbinensis]MCI1851514.1 PTS transporter subunit EIIC [Schleiferilactobacillus harbinensis]QEU47573.1 PTS sugar transporter subunit IIC [Schleiferilactobacillus harbinensis]